LVALTHLVWPPAVSDRVGSIPMHAYYVAEYYLAT
jgi:hypothetical protein